MVCRIFSTFLAICCRPSRTAECLPTPPSPGPSSGSPAMTARALPPGPFAGDPRHSGG